MRRLPLLALVAACGASNVSPSPPPVTATDVPSLLDRPIWDGELADPTALHLLTQVKAALDVSPPLLEGTDSAAWTKPIQDWIGKRVELGKAISADAETLLARPDPRFQLLAAIVLGVSGDDLVTDLTSIALPPEVVKSEYGAEVNKVFRETLEDKAGAVAERTRVALQKCMTLAPQAATMLRAWEQYCRDRDIKLGELVTRVSVRGGSSTGSKPLPGKRQPALFTDCDSKEVLHLAPTALPPDMKVKPAVAYIYDGDDVDGKDVDRLEAAVAAKLGAATKMPVVTAKELGTARALVAQKKLYAKGPTCGQAPELTAVVAYKRKHLVIGRIQTSCIIEDTSAKTKRCGLQVQYSRAGSDDQQGLPGAQFAPVATPEASAADYIAAAEQLAPDQGSAGLLGFAGKDHAVQLALSGYADDDPWLRVGWTLRTDTATVLDGCVDAEGSFDATFTITREGKTKDVALAPVSAPPAGSKVAECVKSALEATAWPCTRDGKPAKVAVRMCVAPR